MTRIYIPATIQGMALTAIGNARRAAVALEAYATPATLEATDAALARAIRELQQVRRDCRAEAVAARKAERASRRPMADSFAIPAMPGVA